jgi:hypothetical protein
VDNLKHISFGQDHSVHLYYILEVAVEVAEDIVNLLQLVDMAVDSCCL